MAIYCSHVCAGVGKLAAAPISAGSALVEHASTRHLRRADGGGPGAAFTPNARHSRRDGADGAPTRIGATQRDDLQRAIGRGWDRRPRFESPSAWNHANGPANGRRAKPAQRADPGASAEECAWARRPAMPISTLLIRGFGVQVPGGAPVSDSAASRADFAGVAALSSLAPLKIHLYGALGLSDRPPQEGFRKSAGAFTPCVGVTERAHELVA
jgi:hypothetical protein